LKAQAKFDVGERPFADAWLSRRVKQNLGLSQHEAMTHEVTRERNDADPATTANGQNSMDDHPKVARMQPMRQFFQGRPVDFLGRLAGG
jgi:hypothetical protein